MSIELKNVTYTYSQGTAYESHALKDINLVIPDGQFIGVIGHTGSGKSTLIQHLNALIQPTSGQILYNGEDDDVINPSGQESFVKEVEKVYEDKKLLNFKLFEMTGHQVTTQMLEEAIKFSKEVGKF